VNGVPVHCAVASCRCRYDLGVGSVSVSVSVSVISTVILRVASQVDALVDQIEKNMNHLKHEAAAKLKAYGAARRYDGDLEALRNKNAILAKRNATREMVITELKVRGVLCGAACCYCSVLRDTCRRRRRA
jgi:hypothetical protein